MDPLLAGSVPRSHMDLQISAFWPVFALVLLLPLSSEVQLLCLGPLSPQHPL